jgi:cysteinyl-tRNA synthetase
MNITDIDDKVSFPSHPHSTRTCSNQARGQIIARARQIHLFTTFRDSQPSLTRDLISTLRTALGFYFSSNITSLVFPDRPSDEAISEPEWRTILKRSEEDPAWVAELTARKEKFGMYAKALVAARNSIDEAERRLEQGKTGKGEAEEAIDGAADVVREWLDHEVRNILSNPSTPFPHARLLSQRGATVTDRSIFRAHAAYWERDYFNDMAALNVEPPTTLTRVSEYVPEIVKFVEGVISNGYAYESKGSVYFDTRAFDGAKGGKSADQANGVNGQEDGWRHTYAKLQPWSKDNKTLLDEGEGASVALFLFLPTSRALTPRQAR